MRTATFSTFALLLASAAPGYAQVTGDSPTAEELDEKPARTLSLREALDVLVRQSPDLVRTDVDISIADANLLSTQGLDDWVLSATGAWISNHRNFIPGQPFQTTADDTLSLSAQVTRNLPSGGTVGLKLNGAWADTNFAVLQSDFGFDLDYLSECVSAPDECDPNSILVMSEPERADYATKTTTGSLVATFTHPLLRGRGEKVARATQRRAKETRDAATLARRAAALDAVAAAVTTYWELAYASREVEIRRGSVELAREQLRITREAIAGEVAAPTDALAIEQAIAVREQALLLAKVAVSERSLQLRELVGLEVGPGEVDLATTDALAIEERALDLDQELELARTNNPRLELLRTSNATAEIDVELARDEMRPRLDFSASIGPAGTSTKASQTLEELGTFGGFTASASLTYTQALRGRGAHGAYQSARQTKRRSRVDLAAAEREIAVAVVRAVNLVRTAKKRIEVSAIAIRLAEQNLDAERILFQAGSARSFDVLARQDELEHAQLDRARAEIDYLEATAQLDALTGQLLSRYGVDVLSDT